MTELLNFGCDGCADIPSLNLGALVFKPKSRLEAKNAALRHQLIVLQRRMKARVELGHPRAKNYTPSQQDDNGVVRYSNSDRPTSDLGHLRR
jgi:hypothetical protein